MCAFCASVSTWRALTRRLTILGRRWLKLVRGWLRAVPGTSSLMGQSEMSIQCHVTSSPPITAHLDGHVGEVERQRQQRLQQVDGAPPQVSAVNCAEVKYVK